MIKTLFTPLIKAAALALLPPPPSKLIFGVEVYPDPGLVIVMLITTPARIVATASAVVPLEGGSIEINGAVSYPAPPSAIVIPVSEPLPISDVAAA